MKIACLVSVYRDPQQLARLVESLREIADFYIHIDKRVDAKPFYEALAGVANVEFVKNRVNVSWGGFSQVEVIVGMLECAIKSKKTKYVRVLSLTGMDFPIWPNEKIIDEFRRNGDKEYISGFNITKSLSERQKRKINKYWYFDQPYRSLMAKKFARLMMNTVSTNLPVTKDIRVEIGGVKKDVYFGSDYWAITLDCAVYLLNSFKEEVKFRGYFKTAFAPSELFAQTIIFNSKFRANAYLYDGHKFPGLIKLTPLHYIVYGAEVKVFTDGDYWELVDSGKMFFRKASTEKSGALMDKLDVIRHH